ncbi:hypothetical protein PG999_000688 [Apiospora kogelbergensis]|uniref:non-specific serine/threonine protein kinase n=1 Tax=Apiospora kogelbergensis TaxID=1337665 RepID=A0AAW0RC73_9PEZI
MAFEPGNVTPIRETLEEIGPAAPANIVHFDIDPSNIMIGDFQDEAPEHAVQPVFKLGDFGLTQEITGQYDRAALIRLQYGGKHGYRAPEQERGKDLVELGLFEPDIDTYGIHTNIWGIGVVADSYGWFLVEDAAKVPRGMETLYQRFPAELRELVARCMCSDSQQRPTLGYLLPAIQHYIAQGDALEAQGRSPPGENNADLEQFCREFILGNQSEASTISQEDEEDEARDGLGPLPGAAVQAAGNAFRRRSQSRSLSTTNGASPTSVYGGNQPSAENWAGREIVVGGANANANANDTQQSRYWDANGGSRAASVAYVQAEAQHLQRRQSTFGVDDEIEMDMDYWN